MTTFPGEARLSFLRPTFPSNINPFLSPSASPASSAVTSSRPPCGLQPRGLGERKAGCRQEGAGRTQAAGTDSHGGGAVTSSQIQTEHSHPQGLCREGNAAVVKRPQFQEPQACSKRQEATATLSMLVTNQAGKLPGLAGLKISGSKKHYFPPPNNMIMILKIPTRKFSFSS